jgi:hypothetical protein
LAKNLFISRSGRFQKSDPVKNRLDRQHCFYDGKRKVLFRALYSRWVTIKKSRLPSLWRFNYAARPDEAGAVTRCGLAPNFMFKIGGLLKMSQPFLTFHILTMSVALIRLLNFVCFKKQ